MRFCPARLKLNFWGFGSCEVSLNCGVNSLLLPALLMYSATFVELFRLPGILEAIGFVLGYL